MQDWGKQSPEESLLIIEGDEDDVTFSASIAANVRFTVDFDVSIWDSTDRESVSIGSTEHEIYKDVNLSIVVTASRVMIDGVPEDLSITASPPRLRLHFGRVVPDWRYDD